MNRPLSMALAAALVQLAGPAPALAQSQGAAPVEVCSLVSNEEVKKHFPWNAALDQFPPEEEAVGTAGSSCNYPTVHVQVLKFAQATIDNLRKRGGVETVAGVGDAAWLRNNSGEYAELFVKVGERLLTLQADLNGDMAAARPKVVALAQAYVAKLR